MPLKTCFEQDNIVWISEQNILDTMLIYVTMYTKLFSNGGHVIFSSHCITGIEQELTKIEIATTKYTQFCIGNVK